MKAAQLYDDVMKNRTEGLLELFRDQDRIKSMQREYSLSLDENKENGWDFVKVLKEKNSVYNYFADNKQTYELYKQLYLALQLFSLLKDNIFFFDRRDSDFFAYQVMVYFGGEGDIKKTLEAFDVYCEENSIKDAQLSKLFPAKLRKLTQSISLSHWQSIIRQGASRNLLLLFDIAPEIEQFLGRAPTDLQEVNAAISRLVKEKAYSHEELVQMVLASDSVSTWIMELNEHNFSELINSPNAFCKIMPYITNVESQKAVLIRINPKKALLEAERGATLKKMVAAVTADNVGKVLQLVDFNQQIKQCNSRADLIGVIENNLYPQHHSTYLMDHLDEKELKKCIRSVYDMGCLLQKVTVQDRLAFLTNKIGKETFLALKPSRDDFFTILSDLPPENRFQFVTMLPNEVLKAIHRNKSDWQKLKGYFPHEEQANKSALSKRVYSEEALQAKAILKNVKSTIKSTPWVDEFLAPLVETTWKRSSIRAPASVHKQIDVYKALSTGCLTHQEALTKVKERGREMATPYKSAFSSVSTLFLGKSLTQAYFKHFETEESFDAKFGFKPSSK